jgi:hypothetical protein
MVAWLIHTPPSLVVPLSELSLHCVCLFPRNQAPSRKVYIWIRGVCWLGQLAADNEDKKSKIVAFFSFSPISKQRSYTAKGCICELSYRLSEACFWPVLQSCLSIVLRKVVVIRSLKAGGLAEHPLLGNTQLQPQNPTSPKACTVSVVSHLR